MPEPLTASLAALPHHDGSPLYVSSAAPALGDVVTVWLRVPASLPVTSVHVRTTPDAEPFFTTAVLDEERTGRPVGGYGATDRWWCADVVVRNPVTTYRWLVVGPGEGGPARKRWVTAAGTVGHDVRDATDFRLVAGEAPPAWTADAVVYEIFPDRFARSGAAGPVRPESLPPWAIPCDWDVDEVVGRGDPTPRQVFGGDLDGVAEHLDHVEALGADTIYLRPVFPARSCHRYDASSFDRVDPIAGGDAALERLSAAAHVRGLRLVGDITTNHCGAGHEWFERAVQDPASPERGMFLFDEDGAYESWYGVPSLPKLDWRSPLVRERMTATVRRWLPLYDGWRVDVANMTGRSGDVDVNHEVSRHLAAELADAHPEPMLVGEHNHDAGPDLDAGGWQGTMNYAGFTRPVWSWLRGDGPDVDALDFAGEPGGIPRRDGEEVVATLRSFAAGMSWRSLRHSWNLLDSFDVARIRSVAGSRARHLVGVALQATLPGTPMVCAGSEFGLHGTHGEDARTPMPWDRPDDRDEETLASYQAWFGLRRREPALREGGLRWLHVEADRMVWLRETAEESLLVVADRAACGPLEVGIDAVLEPVLEPVTPDVTEPPTAGIPEGIVAEGGSVTLPGSSGPGVRVWRVRAPR